MNKIVKGLFAKIDGRPRALRSKDRKSAAAYLKDFKIYLAYLNEKHSKRNYINDTAYVVDWIFDNNKILKNDQQVTTYCKLHLCVATHCFNHLVDQIAANKGGFTYSNIRKYRNIIYDYLHDLREIVEHLEKKNRSVIQLLQRWQVLWYKDN